MKNEYGEVPVAGGRDGCDKALGVCRVTDKADSGVGFAVALPRWARLPINRCNLPAAILGGLTFNAHPAALALDGIAALHRPLLNMLDQIEDRWERARGFAHYVSEHFRLERPEDAGLASCDAKRVTRAPCAPAGPVRRRNRARASYLRVVRGWLFDPDGREAAVLKGWVESRFGLTPRHHREPLRDPTSTAYIQYLEDRSTGLYGTNALEEQLDLLYTYCQYELGRQPGQRPHRDLFRGVNRMHAHERLAVLDRRREVLLLNNLNSFSSSRERAGEFGDYILSAAVPTSKILFFNDLLPGMARGEDEYAVIGGLYEVAVTSL
jgi:NAD+--dinitrogen-reductase ADP-D-ribosyltransferase